MDRANFDLHVPAKHMTTLKPSMRAGIYALLLVCCLVVTFLTGKDWNADLLHYHLYAGYTALDGNILNEYFPSSWHAYLNPYAHLPFYWLIKHGFQPLWIAFVLASFHALNLVLLFETAVLLNRRSTGSVAWWAVGISLFFALANPIFLQELGSSYIENSTSVFVVAGWYGLIRAYNGSALRWLFVSGLLIGIGIALKVTNVYFSVTALPLLLLLPKSKIFRLRAVLVFAAGGIVGVLLAGGWWSWQLWELFKNPVFPMLNQVFASPDFVPEAMKHYRFLPTSWLDALLRPVAIVMPHTDVYTELLAPDLRYAILLLLPLLFLAKRESQRMAGASPAEPLLLPFQHRRALLGLGLALLLSWALWLPTSGNGRYMVPMSLLSSVLLGSLLARLSNGGRALTYGMMIVIATQSILVGFGDSQRWNNLTQWDDKWFSIELPPELKQSPTLHLSLDLNAASFLVPFLAPGSAMINTSGQYALAPNQRIADLMAKYPGQVRALHAANITASDMAGKMNFSLYRFGLQIDPGDCKIIRYHAGDRMVPVRVENKVETAFKAHTYRSCAIKGLQQSSEQRAQYDTNKQIADRIFDQFEDRCPELFSPRRVLTEGDGNKFMRDYVNSDSQLALTVGGKVSYRKVYPSGVEISKWQVKDLLGKFPPAALACLVSVPD